MFPLVCLTLNQSWETWRSELLTPVFSEWDGASTMLYYMQQQLQFPNQPWKELNALITCSYTLMPLRNTLSSRNSLLSWSSIGVFVIGENPRAGMPSCLTKRESVVEDKISGLDSFPPAEVIACSNTDHHGFDSLVAVNMGRPATSITGPFCISS